MNYPIPANTKDIVALGHSAVDDEVVAAAVAAVIRMARTEGRSLEELTAEVMADDSLLDADVRQQLSDVLAIAWARLPDDRQPS